MYRLRRAAYCFRNHEFLPSRTFSTIFKPSTLPQPSRSFHLPLAAPSFASRTFSSTPPPVTDVADALAAIDYSSVLQENEFHELADSTINHLLEKLEEYGDNVDIDGFDIDYGNEVLTLRLGNLGTYVVNKQTPNRQIWLSSPVSGPARFDWDRNAQAWVYRRNKASLFNVLETELEKLCGEPVILS